MAEKEQQTANGYSRSADAEAAASHDARELRRKKRNKCFLYIALFVVFQIAVITAFSLTVMKVKTPKFRLRQATITNLNIPASGALQATVDPQFSVKNTNFGRYKYRATTVEFFYGDAKIGQASIPNSKAGWISTKKLEIPEVELSISSSPELSRDVSSGSVPIRSSARMNGRVELIFIMKKNKATDMNCTMDISIPTNTLTNIRCK